MNDVSKRFREDLISLVKASGQEIIDRAEDLVGNGDLICDFDIWLRFPQNAIPTIDVTRSHISKNACHVITDRKDD